MAQGKPGRPKKYETPGKLRKAIDVYWRSISYEKPVVVATPTGEVDENGRIKYTSRMLMADETGAVSMDGIGRPITETAFLKPPSVAGLCLHLGISKETWSTYKEDEKLGPVCQEFLLRYEDYLLERVEGEKAKSVQGIIFNLKNNFDYREKVETEQKHDATVHVELDEGARELAE